MKNQQTLNSILEKLVNLGVSQKKEVDDLHEEIRDFMLKMREQMGETAEQFASRCGGVKRHYIYMIESGSRRWSREMLESFSKSIAP